jgi:polyisoprenoid-binding protein YceI
MQPVPGLTQGFTREPKGGGMSNVETKRAMVRVPPGTWTVDPIHSSVGFKIKHMMIATVRGHFSEFEGTIVAAEDDPANSHAMGTVKVASIDTGNADRDAHLRSPDFFDAEQYPDITFESTRIRHIDGGTFSLAGNLTIRDITREVEMEARVEGADTDPWGMERVGISVRGTINRTDFGLKWQERLAAGGMLVGEDVTIQIDISAIRS